ncbi:MAG: hypothetical protein LBQ60_07715 [Bacteroidales bacterium]|jgi:hypothetical protein|nr:hypothetical protein [Bacteroidales bacterium]
MTGIRFRKEKISIQKIGKQRFWIGVIAGFFSAVLISLFSSYVREAFRVMTGTSPDLLILEGHELNFFNFFFSVLSTVLGLSIAIWIWMSHRASGKKTNHIYQLLSQTNAFVIFWVIIMLVARVGSIISLLLFSSAGYDDHLNLYEEYRIIFILIPVVVFMQNWLSVRHVYRAGKWIFLSFLFCVLTACILRLTTTVDQEIVNKAYHGRYKSDYQYIEEVISDAGINYGIKFDTKTTETLKKWNSESSVKQVMNVKSAFSNNKQVSLDTIILQKIIIKNYKQGRYIFNKRNSMENWYYALPTDILKQLAFFDIESDQTKELFAVLKEQIDLVNTQVPNWEEKKYTYTEVRRYFGARHDIPEIAIRQLRSVRDSLVKNEEYFHFTKDLPEIKNERISGDKNILDDGQ